MDAFPPAKALSLEHSRNLDLLRAIAVLCVVASHAAREFFGFVALGSLGRFGVMLFFFHTALVLMQSLDRMAESAVGWRLVLAFWVRRAFRIYPLALVCVAVAFVLHLPPNGGVAGGGDSVGLRALASNLLLVQNLTHRPDILGPLWSLPLEVQMYVLLPALFFAVRRYRVPAVLLWCVSVVAAVAAPHLSTRLNMFWFAPCFTAGILAWQAETAGRRQLRWWLWPVFIALAAVVFGPFDDAVITAKLPLAWIATLMVSGSYLYLCDAPSMWLTTAAHRLAEISYGIYLSHVFVIALCLRLFHSHAAQLLGFVMLVPLLSTFLYRTVERPGIAAGRLMSRAVEGSLYGSG